MSEEMEITVGRHTVRLDERERRLMREIRSGRERETKYITDTRSLESLKRKQLVHARRGRLKIDVNHYARTGVPMKQEEEAHLTGLGVNVYREMERIERERQDSRRRGGKHDERTDT